MHLDHLHAIIPLERYRAILAALAPERESWLDDFWLRFAAHVAVLCPDDPSTIAARIRHLAAGLAAHAKWYQDLASPARFAVAALLLLHHLPFRDFIAEHSRSAELFGEVGLPNSGFNHTLTVLILLITPNRHMRSMLEAGRLKAIHSGMKSYHWWLTGPEDMPACAALAQCHGSAEEIVARTEVCYRRLHEAGLNIGDHLQTAANLLPLAGTDPDASVTRYRALKSALEAREVTLLPAHYESLSLLTLLDHRPETVVDRMLAVLNELDLLQPEVLISANLAIAADLTILDLMRYDRDLRPLHDAHGAQTMLHNLHVFNLASIAMLGRVSGELAMPAMEALAAEWPPSM